MKERHRQTRPVAGNPSAAAIAPRGPASLRWKPNEISREAVQEATYSYLDQLFRSHRRPLPTQP